MGSVPRFFLSICAIFAVVTCAKPPKGEGYRRVELFSAGKSTIEFTCQIGGGPSHTFVASTPWAIELDLDTMDGSWPYRCQVTRTDPGPDRLWVWASDRESLRLDKYLATHHDRVDFDMRYWICWQGKP